MSQTWGRPSLPPPSITFCPIPPEMITYHTFPHLLRHGGRLAATIWEDAETTEQAVAATVKSDDQAIVLVAKVANGVYLRGKMPGGMNTI